MIQASASLLPRAVLFDMDGVLVDSAPYHLESWKLFVAAHGISIPPGFMEFSFGRVNKVILPHLFGRALTEDEIRDLSNHKESLYRDLIAGSARPIPGVDVLLRAARRAGWRTAVASAAQRANVTFILDKLHIADEFDALVTGDDVRNGKPDPEVFLQAASRLAVAPDCCVVIEDSIHGVEAARRAGMACLAITTTHPGPALYEAHATHVVESFRTVGVDTLDSVLSRRRSADAPTSAGEGALA